MAGKDLTSNIVSTILLYTFQTATSFKQLCVVLVVSMLMKITNLLPVNILQMAEKAIVIFHLR